MSCSRRLLLAGALLMPQLLHAQGAPHPSQSAEAEMTAPKSWLVWRVFHSSLVFYMQGSPAEVYSMLGERASLAESEVAILLDSGAEYLRALIIVDEAAANDVEAIRKRLGRPEDVLSTYRQSPAASIDDAGVVRIDVGRLVRDALVAEGVVGRVSEEREAAYRRHRRYLAETLGESKLASLDRLVETSVAPNVRVFSAPRADFWD